MKENVLYVGSGKSAELIKGIDLSKYKVLCANNAWRLFEKNKFYGWIHSGDFPRENFPKTKKYQIEVCHKDYSKTALEAKEFFKWKVNSPQHHYGYTIFFQGLYWIIMRMRPSKISLLGFDHDYNKEKVNKWNKEGRPQPQNKYCNKKENSTKEWGANFFKDMETDAFYGHGTPDPLRLGKDHLLNKFKLAIDCCRKLNIELVNLSPVVSDINIVKKEEIP
jgi:hypothetical protein